MSFLTMKNFSLRCVAILVGLTALSGNLADAQLSKAAAKILKPRFPKPKPPKTPDFNSPRIPRPRPTAHYVTCSRCSGSGEVTEYVTVECLDCYGRKSWCSVCRGKGVISGYITNTCTSCYGSGQVKD